MDESEMRMDKRVRKSMRELLREAFVTGLAVVVPLLVTAIVLAIALQYVHTYLSLFAEAVMAAGDQVHIPLYGDMPIGQLAVEVLTPLILLWFILIVGLFTNATHLGERAVDYFDYFISQIPAIGGVYESFRQMSDVVLESDTQNFRDVKLVEFPHEGAYTLGFVTTETPAPLSGPAGHAEMLTLFLPLAPNPVMGGHLVHMPAEKVMDVDMTVEEGIRAIVTSGVAVSGGGVAGAGLDEGDLRELASIEHADQQLNPGMDSPNVRRAEEVNTNRSDVYDESVEPARATTPDDIARRERPEDVTGVDTDIPAERIHGIDSDAYVTPAEESGRYQPEAEATDQRPAELADRDAEDRDSTEERPAELADRDAAERDTTEERPAELADRDAAERDTTEERPAELADRDAEERDETEQRPSKESPDERGKRS
ncbi:MAG: DUF502 domain-containing protein [Halolamina sp.]